MEMGTRGRRISFYVSDELSKKAVEIAGKLNLTLSDFARNAILKSIESMEKSKLEQELIDGYKANYTYYINQQKAWEHADSE